MNRRNYLKTIGSTTLAPTITVPDYATDEIPYEYLEWLFSEYSTIQFSETAHGQGFSADWSTDKNTKYFLQYRVFQNHDSIFTVQYTSAGEPRNVRVDGLVHRDAYEYCEIGRNQGLEPLLTTLDTLESEKSFRCSKFVTYIIDTSE